MNIQIAIALVAAGLLGQFASYATKAMTGSLWGGDVERNPFKAAFWSDLICYLKERPGRTTAAVVTNLFSVLGAAVAALKMGSPGLLELAAGALLIGWASDLMINRANAA